MTSTSKPIGYWLKRLDRAIDDAFDRDIGTTGLTRRQWQILNVLTDGPQSRRDLVAALAPFWERPAAKDGEPDNDPDRVVSGMAAAGLVALRGDDVHITGLGERRRAAARAAVQRTRERLMTGLTADDYAKVIDVLSRMVANLESGAADGSPASERTTPVG